MMLFHGGIPGLKAGDTIEPGHSRDNRHPGCAICDARAKGQHIGIDPPSARPDRVYVTEDRDYARFHASMYGHGDLYEVAPESACEPSVEDKFPSFTCASAQVVSVCARAVLLTPGQRRRFFIRWARLDGLSLRDAHAAYAQMLAGVR